MYAGPGALFGGNHLAGLDGVGVLEPLVGIPHPRRAKPGSGQHLFPNPGAVRNTQATVSVPVLSLMRVPAIRVADGVIKRFFETDPPRFLEVPFGSIDETAGRKLYEGAGFNSVDVAIVNETSDVKSHEDVARGLVTGNPTILEVEARATVGADELIAAIVQELENAFGPAPVGLPFQEIVFLATK